MAPDPRIARNNSYQITAYHYLRTYPNHAQEQQNCWFPERDLAATYLGLSTMCVNILRSGHTDNHVQLMVLTTF